MKSLEVRMQLDSDALRPVGILAEKSRRIYFEYDADFIRSGLWLSPFKVPLKAGLHEHKDINFGPVFGLFDDSLPDGWGLLLMDRFFRQKGISPENVSVLDRLSYIGSHAMGALTYHPAMSKDESATEQFINLHNMAGQAYQVMTGDVGDLLPLLLRAGGSPGGARPKVLIGVKDEQMISGEGDLPEGYGHWLVKFFSAKECCDEGRVEFAYSKMAKAAGIQMSDTRLFLTNEGDAFFGVERFDRKKNQRFHIHSFGNMIHSNFRIPSCDYEMFLRVTRILTKNHSDVVAAFRMMVFNILAFNRDDHVKNFSYIMDHTGGWHLAPAYDLTFAAGPGGEHSMTVAGEGRTPRREHLFTLAEGAGLERRHVLSILEEVMESVAGWRQYALDSGVGKQRLQAIKQRIEEAMKGLGP